MLREGGSKSCQCLWAMAPCEVIIIHRQLSVGLLLWETQKSMTDGKRGKRWVENIATLFYIVTPHFPLHPPPNIAAVLPTVESSHFPRKMRFAVPWRRMIPFNLSYWSTRFQNSNRAFLSVLFFLKASHILCLSAVDFEHAPVPVLIVRRISWAT